LTLAENPRAMKQRGILIHAVIDHYMKKSGLNSQVQFIDFLPSILHDTKPLVTCLLLLLTTAGHAAESASPETTVSVRLADLDPLSAQQGWGSLGINQSVQGKTLQIGDRPFTNGLGTHANGELVYQLDQAYERFEAWVGVDAEMNQYKEASVVFKVIADGRELFTSGVMHVDSPAQRVSLPLHDVSELKLVVTDAGDGIDADHADWADAVLIGNPKLLKAATLPPPQPARFKVRARGLTIELSEQGQIVGASFDKRTLRRLVQGGTVLAGCTNVGQVTSRKWMGGEVEFTRTLRRIVSGRSLTVVDSFKPAGESVRWETQITSDGEPWTTDITTELDYPATPATRFWTAWSDPEHKTGEWRDPLVLSPLTKTAWTFGGPVLNGGYTALPLATLAEPSEDLGLSLVFSPEDTVLTASRLSTSSSGAIRFSRTHHRLGGGKTVRFAMDLVAHEADWRGGLRWITERYPKFFQPPNPHADAMAGCGAYSGDEGAIDVAKLKKMAFRINWKLSDDFPYMGMFIPPVKNMDEQWERSCDESAPADKPRWTSCRRLNDYAHYMKTNGFYVLDYFNVTEFGKNMGTAPVKKPGDPELWKDPHAFLATQLPGAILLDGNATCYAASVVDPGDAVFQKFILEQADRHIRWIPDSSGICIDRLDWLDRSNARADDGVSWIDGKPARSLCVSWINLMSQLGPKMHRADKIILVNPIYARLDLLRQVDGIYTEMGNDGRALNASAFLCLDKPMLAWSYNETLKQPDPDSFFQRHLLLGAFPTAPYPWNNHCITPEPSADQQFLDYGPLLDSLRGKKWVLTAHCVATDTPGVKVNLFRVTEGYSLPVTFGGTNEFVTLRVRNLPGLEKLHCQALLPGIDTPAPVSATLKNDEMELKVPLKRGCAVVRLLTR